MFKQLQKQMLRITMGSMFILLVIMFAALHVISSNRIFDKIEREFDDAVMDIELDEIRYWVFEEDEFTGLSLSVELDSNGNIVEVYPEDVYSDNDLNTLLSKVDKEQGDITVDDTHYKYIQLEVEGHTFIRFINASAERHLQNSLIAWFARIFVVAMIIVYFISRYLAKRSIRPVKEAFDKQKQFVSDASHELKTPLTVLTANLDVLDKTELDDGQKKWVQYMHDEVDRMAKLTNTLLYLSKISEETTVPTDEFDISKMLEGTILSFESLAFEKSITLNYDIEPNIKFKGDSEQIRSLLGILIDNAIKYTKDSINIKLTSNKSIEIIVSNNGEPIPEDKINNIFERFYRVDQARNSKENSFGLGLSIAKQIVENHNGEITCQSGNDQTTFKVKLRH